MENLEYKELNDQEIEAVSGGFVCGGLCILGGIVAGVSLFGAGVAIGKEIYTATK